MCGQKVTLPGGVDPVGWLSQSHAQIVPSWVSTKMHAQRSLSCRKTMLISFCVSSGFHCTFSDISLGDILYFHAVLLKEPVKHKRTNWFRKQISFMLVLIKPFVL